MADKKEAAEKPAKAAKPKGKGGGMLLGLGALILGIGLLPVTLILLAGMLPTLAMALGDKNPKRNLTTTIGALNLASTAYLVMELLKKGFSLDYAVQLLSVPGNWLALWAGAAVGYALFQFIPPAVAQVIAALSEIRITRLKSNLQELKKIWSEEVSK